MATLIVTNNADSGAGSLRQTILNAEMIAGDDTIVFDPNVFNNGASPIVLTSGALVIAVNQHVIINGDTDGDGDFDVVISGDANGNGLHDAADSNHFNIAGGTEVFLQSLSMVDGYAKVDPSHSGLGRAGSIDFGSGFLSITDCVFYDNAANTGNAQFSSTPGGQGTAAAGHIYSIGTLRITDTHMEYGAAAGVGGGAGASQTNSNGAVGGTGGIAAGSIVNVGGDLNFTRLQIGHSTGTGGLGGTGGGSSSGSGGAGGNGGFGVGAIYSTNFGTSTVTGSLQFSQTAGIGGQGGSGAFGAVGGQASSGSNGPTNLGIAEYSAGNFTVINNLGTFQNDSFTEINGTFYGMGGNDNLTGAFYTYSILHGGTGNDTLSSASAYAVTSAFGERGNDTLVNVAINGGTWDGGDGIDTLNVSANSLTNQTFDLNAASFVVNGATFSGFENIIATQGNDIIIDKTGISNINGFDGNDTIFMAAESRLGNVLNGGVGNDTLVSDLFWVSQHTFDLSTGFLTFIGNSFDQLLSIENITVGGGATVIGDGNDNIITVTQTYGAYANTIDGGGGDDTIEGAQGADILSGAANGLFGDTVSYRQSAAGVTVNLANAIQAGSGDAAGDSLFGFENVMGSANADSLIGNGGNNVLTGLSGGDTLNGGSGTGDTADYTESNAAVTVSINGAGSASGGHAAGDVLIDIENLTGSGFGDTLTGSTSVNILNGGGGNDTLLGGAAGDTLNGGDGTSDTVSYSGSNAGVNVNLFLNSATGGHATGDTISGFENVTGSSQSDVIAGDGNANVLKGELGTGDMITYANSNAFVNVNLTTNAVSGGFAQGDTISGFERVIGSNFDDFLAGTVFANSLAGGGGNDTIFGDAGADNLTGGNGFDTLDYTTSSGGVTINLLTSASSGGNAQGDIIGTFERVNGSNTGVDVLTGNTAVNILRGNGGNDFIEGGAGGDTLDGGAGSADTLVYTSSNAAVIVNIGLNTASGGHAQLDIISNFERLTGSDFGDTLTGTTGSNILKGGLGNDSLTGGAGSDTFVFDTTLGATNIDSITDFSVPQDTIQLDNLIFTALTDGALNATLFGFAATADTTDRIIYNQATGQLFYDTNGSTAGGSTQIATLATGLAMTAADFFVI